jgi:hypothetical protein
MKEREVRPGARIYRECEELVAYAPAFMVFNGTRVEAHPGDTADAVYGRWLAARYPTQPESDE